MTQSIREKQISYAEPKSSLRDKIEADIAAFFGAGHDIQQVPSGVSGEKDKTLRQHMTAFNFMDQERKL